MSTPPLSDYYYGSEADQYTFYRLPKALFTNGRYKSLSDGAKILYGLMLDRMGLSMKNGWLDEQNRVFIFFTLEDVQEYIRICTSYPGMASPHITMPLQTLSREIFKSGIASNLKTLPHTGRTT